MIGTTVLHYKIISKLGEGGMGVVYKAEDTKLKREVALKFLPTNALQSQAEKDRFLREAQAAAAFSHPNIAHIYAIEEDHTDAEGAVGQMFIVMEYIDGMSLEELVGENGGAPLPLDKAIEYTIQIAAGLQAAQEKGITHRDIKSANIMVDERGVVKIMDFGLAKLAHRTKMTMEGSTLGTASYMSPEQARGEEADHRADIWSLGVVLYEMVCGRLPFKGEFEQAVIYSILNEDPEPLTGLRSGLPIELDAIIAKALSKDPETRYQNVAELPADLRALDASTPGLSRISVAAHPPAASRPGSHSRLPWIMFGLATLVALVSLGLLWTAPREGPEPITRFAIPLPQDHHVDLGSDWVQPAVSPDGRMIVYATQNPRGAGQLYGATQLYLRNLDELEPTPISGTEHGHDPFISPDGQWIGFRTEDGLWKIPLFGGKRIRLAEIDGGGVTAAWADGSVIWTPRFDAALWQTSDQGDMWKPLTELDSTKDEAGHRFPQLLPDGEHVLFTIKPASSNFDEATIATVSLKTGDIKRLFTGGSYARYVPGGFLIYMLDQKLMGVPFDADRQEIQGTPVKLLEGVSYDVYYGSPQLAFSNAGTMVYLPSETPPADFRLAWLNRNGTATPISRPLGSMHSASLSPDGKSVAVSVQQGSSEENLAVLELERQVLTNLTVNKTHKDVNPFWAPDGERVGYWSVRPDKVGLFWKRRDGTGAVERLVAGWVDERPGAWTPDARTLVYVAVGPRTVADIWLMGYPDKETRVFLNEPYAEEAPAFSPDGEWIAYASNESGQYEIFLRPFPGKEPKVRISNDGGHTPFWSRDGDELFYQNGRRIMAVPMQLRPGLKPGVPTKLFDLLPGYKLANGITHDSQKFLALHSESEETPAGKHLVVVQNWFEEIKRKMQEASR